MSPECSKLYSTMCIHIRANRTWAAQGNRSHALGSGPSYGWLARASPNPEPNCSLQLLASHWPIKVGRQTFVSARWH